MTKLTYTLYDGTKTTSYAIALASGRPFKRTYEPVREHTPADPAVIAKRLEAIRNHRKNVPIGG